MFQLLDIALKVSKFFDFRSDMSILALATTLFFNLA